MIQSVNRRALLGALAVAPIAALPAASANAVPDTARWDRAVAAYYAANQADQRFFDHRLEPVQELAPTCTAYSPQRVGTTRAGEPLYHRFTRAELLDEDCSYAFFKNRGWIAARSALLDFEKEYAAFEAKHNYSALIAESDRLNEAFANAEEALLLTPAPHVAALSTKLLIATDHSGRFVYENPAVVFAIRADAERLRQ